MLQRIDRRLLVTGGLTQVLLGCGSTPVTGRGSGGGVAIREERTRNRSAANISFWQDSVTEFGQDISIVLGRLGRRSSPSAAGGSFLDREISEIVKQQYAIAGRLASVSFDNVSISTSRRTEMELEIKHSSMSGTVRGAELPSDGRRLPRYFGLMGRDYSWTINVEGSLRYTTITPSRYTSQLKAAVTMVRERVPLVTGADWITQEAVNSAAYHFSKDLSDQTARMLERRYGLPEGAIKINMHEPGGSFS